MLYYLHQPERLAAGVTQAEVLGALDVLPRMISPGKMGTGIVEQSASIRTPQKRGNYYRVRSSGNQVVHKTGFPCNT